MKQIACRVCGHLFDSSRWECPNCGAPAPLDDGSSLQPAVTASSALAMAQPPILDLRRRGEAVADCLPH